MKIEITFNPVTGEFKLATDIVSTQATAVIEPPVTTDVDTTEYEVKMVEILKMIEPVDEYQFADTVLIDNLPITNKRTSCFRPGSLSPLVGITTVGQLREFYDAHGYNKTFDALCTVWKIGTYTATEILRLIRKTKPVNQTFAS